MTAYFKLNDFRLRLDPAGAGSPHGDKLKGDRAIKRFRVIGDELALDAIQKAAKKEGYPDSQVYVDMMPVFVSAVSRVVKALDKVGAKFKGHDAGVYRTPFTSEREVNLQEIGYLLFKLSDISRLFASRSNPKQVRHSTRSP